ncbi:MAG: hypothetical protein ACJ8HJ_01805 [Massilia sp.]
MKSFFQRWYAALVEALLCLLLGLRSSFRNGLWWRSACLCTVVLVFWVWFYWHSAKQIFIAIGAIRRGPRWQSATPVAVSSVSPPDPAPARTS